ncbi:MAG: hypothetical protein A2750_03750 [Candidatus Yanofskybacteria bacterium RIFCSPHIGHO2_01_FULL_45_42]|uniref:Type IV secretion system coupling protein TraD DNA-binding domain-containing protein n=2 Tax=Candidatus Yanofskyibacteriota TaxID=1752733 RepID=A0A1F8H403_9BACT|nr:MAG: hypothetical protein A2750_03750 [Candidatus Yanofskybacteria bacterium RIFCSPHIGHO2_01_FULL_45_42]OGN31738.1 MAG: hypothetical protein A3J01_00210 [Candidatus Yanofskybacteria bacterium RIFCSPLOWO2_02_FULL_45_18]
MSEANNDIVLFGETNFRNKRTVFGIKMDDRRRHMYIIGKSGMGKSELLKNIAIQDIQAGRGLAFIDPHGDPVEDLLDYIPKERVKDVIYINPADLEYPIAFNIMEHVSFDKRHLIADGLLSVFKKIWVDAWSARMEYILGYTILALLETPGATLLGINRVLSDKEYRKHIVENVTDPEVKAFWTQEFAKYTDKFATEAVAAIQNKIGQFVANTLIRNMIGQPKSSFDMRKAMDEGKILLVNLSKGRVGEDASRLLGALMITNIQLAAMSRVDTPMVERKDFILVVDEFQNFATASFANILSEARKFRLSLVIAHQYITQMDEAVSDAVFGNVGTIVTFRVGAEDAEALEKEFTPEFMATDIVNLGFRQIYLKLLIDGVTSKAFSATTMDTIAPLAQSERAAVLENSRKKYGKSREEVEKAIVEWRQPLVATHTEQDEREYRAPRREMPRQFAPWQEQHFQRRESSEPRREFREPVSQIEPSAGKPYQRVFRPPAPVRPVSAPVRPPKNFAPLSQLQSEPVAKQQKQLKAPEQPRKKKEVDLVGLKEILKQSLGTLEQEEKSEE